MHQIKDLKLKLEKKITKVLKHGSLVVSGDYHGVHPRAEIRTCDSQL